MVFFFSPITLLLDYSINQNQCLGFSQVSKTINLIVGIAIGGNKDRISPI
jgi:hypothetical protein